MLSFTRLMTFLLENQRYLIRFLLVGALTAVYYLSFFTLLWKMGLNYHIAVSIAYITSILLYFFANRRFTFQNKDKAIGRQFSKFLVLIAINYLITLIIVHTAVEVWLLHPLIGTMMAIILTTLVNYFVAKWWVFKQSMAPKFKNLENI